MSAGDTIYTSPDLFQIPSPSLVLRNQPSTVAMVHQLMSTGLSVKQCAFAGLNVSLSCSINSESLKLLNARQVETAKPGDNPGELADVAGIYLTINITAQSARA